jgi:hypothetical protein
LQGAGSQGKIIWWVRDTVDASLAGAFAGAPSLIAVYGRNGAIAAQPVNADPATGTAYSGGYYYFTQDGRNSGM